MASPSISCSLKPPAPYKEASSSARPQPTPAAATTAQWSGGSSLRRACVAAAACAVVGMAGGGGGGMAALARDAVAASSADGRVALAVNARAGPPRWSDRRRCPAWRANSLESFLPENLPRPSAQRRFNSVAAAEEAPALAPDAGAVVLARRAGAGCFSL